MTWRSAVLKTAVPTGLSVLLLAIGTTDGHGLNDTSATVSITTVSGYAGHAFVYAQVSQSTVAYPAPTGTGHQSPYFSEWIRQPLATTSCQWIWAVYVFDRATNVQINAPPPTAPQPNFGTTTTVCASPTTTPVDQPPVPDANARLDLDLQVSVAPAIATAGSASVVSAVLSSALTQDLNLYLSMAIEDWSVTTWAVDFGDGQSQTVTGSNGTAIQLSHTYQSPGQYDARTVAFISGHAPLRYGASPPPSVLRRSRQPCAGDGRSETVATVRAASGCRWSRSLPGRGEQHRPRTGISAHRGPSWRSDYPLGSPRDQSRGFAGRRSLPTVRSITVDGMAIGRRTLGRPSRNRNSATPRPRQASTRSVSARAGPPLTRIRGARPRSRSSNSARATARRGS